ncbi:unnamed protein product [Mucor hiemalis]
MTNIPTTRTAYRLTKVGSYKNIKAVQEPLRELQKNEILVKIKAVTLNYRDIVIASGEYPAPINENVTPCSDSAGEVVKVGSDVKDFQVGDRVINSFRPIDFDGPGNFGSEVDGVLCDYRICTSDILVKLPSDSHLSHEEAATLVCAGTTAWDCFYGGGIPLKSGQTVLFLGTGGVSLMGLAIAKAAGATTIITSSSDEKIKYVKEKYGADLGVNYRTHPDWEKEVLALTNGKGVDFVIENAGNGTILKSLASLKRGGQIALVGFLSSNPDQIPDLIIPVMFKNATMRGIGVGPHKETEDLVQFVHEHKIHLPIEATFGFSQEQVHSAYEKLISQTAVGKIVIKVE